jgi:hypothetical protein
MVRSRGSCAGSWACTRISWVGTRKVWLTAWAATSSAKESGSKPRLSAKPTAAPTTRQGAIVMLTLELCGIWIR